MIKDPFLDLLVGAVAAEIGYFTKRGPSVGLPVATHTTAGMYLLSAAADNIELRKTSSFLETQGIQVPRRRLVERVGHVDMDDFCNVGAVAALIVAARRGRAWDVCICKVCRCSCVWCRGQQRGWDGSDVVVSCRKAGVQLRPGEARCS